MVQSKRYYLFDDPSQDLLITSDMGDVFDPFEPSDCATRCLMTWHRPLSMTVDFEEASSFQFVREASLDRTYGEGLRCSASGNLSDR